MNTLDVRDYLENGERLLWESKPKPFHIIEGSEGRDLMFVWTVSLFWLFTIGLVFYNAERIDEAARLLEKMSRQ